MQSDGADAEDHYFFLSAPASPVHYIIRSPPSSTTAADGDCCGGHGAGAAGDFEFFAARAGGGMSSAEDLFVAGRIRVGGGGLSPIRQDEAGREGQDSGDDDEVGDGRATRTSRARSASPPRSPRATTDAEPSPRPFASSSSSTSSSSSAKNIRRRISLRDLLAGTGSGGDAEPEQGGADTAAGAGASRSGFWPLWSKKALLPCPAPLPGRRSTSSDRAAATPAKKLPPGGSARPTTSLPYRQGLVLGCLGLRPRSYELAKSMHPLYSR
jgi:hypothetical protein